MQMMSAGAMGGGISSAIARALGAGRREDADALALHALAIGVLFGLAFTIAVLGGGRWIYGAMGGSGASLRGGTHLFRCGVRGRDPALGLQLARQCDPRHRQHDRPGGGQHRRSRLILIAAVAMPHPGLGTVPAPRHCRGRRRGARLLRVRDRRAPAYLCVRPLPLRPSFRGFRFRWPLFREILRVGALASLITLQTNLTIAITTALIGEFGPAAIAGYGTASRSDLSSCRWSSRHRRPARRHGRNQHRKGQTRRALRVAWIGAAIAAGITEAIGLAAASFPLAWLSLFDSDPAMIDAGTRYLHAVGPSTVSSASAWRSTSRRKVRAACCWPLIANLSRLLIAAGGGLSRTSAHRRSGQWCSSALATALRCSASSTPRRSPVAPGSTSQPVRLVSSRRSLP